MMDVVGISVASGQAITHIQGRTPKGFPDACYLGVQRSMQVNPLIYVTKYMALSTKENHNINNSEGI